MMSTSELCRLAPAIFTARKAWCCNGIANRPENGGIDYRSGANHPSVSLRLVTPDGERLCAGEDFNLHRWPPVPCAKYFDDRAWTAVESFATRVVRGEVCVSSLGRDDDLEPAGVCPGRGVNQDGTRIETLPMYTKGQRKRRTNLRVHLAYYGPAFAGWAWLPSDGATDALFRAPDDERGGARGDAYRPWCRTPSASCSSTSSLGISAG